MRRFINFFSRKSTKLHRIRPPSWHVSLRYYCTADSVSLPRLLPFQIHFNMAETSALESEVYWSLKTEVLIELRDLLVDKLDYEKTLSYLRSKRVIDRRDEEDIKAERTPTKSKEKFLDILSDKGPTAFDHFCHAIGKKCTGQQHLLDIILTTFDKKKQERSKHA